jgi:hypothetical protein
MFVGFEVLTVVVMNVAIFCHIAPCSLYENRCCIFRVKNQPNKKTTCSRWLGMFLIAPCC